MVLQRLDRLLAGDEEPAEEDEEDMAEYADETVQDAFVELEVAPPVQPDVESEATAAALETPPPEASLAPCHTAAVEPGTQRLEFTRGGSNKFWEITIAGVQHTVRFGRIGAKGIPSPRHSRTPRRHGGIASG